MPRTQRPAMTTPEPDWLNVNRANWDERVGVHLTTASYELSSLRRGQGRLHSIEEAELGPVAGLRVLHLQCHFGRDSLTLAQRGAQVTGLDFSGEAVRAATALAAELAAELGLSHRTRFVESDLYRAPQTLAEPASFDLVFVTWGAIYWLPDIRRWAEVVAHFLKPGGSLYLAEGHPAAWVFDDARRADDGMPGWFAPYFGTEALVIDDPRDYADPEARLVNARTYSWAHPLAAIVTALLDAGLTLTSLHEHDRVPWRMFECLVEDGDGMFGWPDQAWLPLSFSLRAECAVQARQTP